MTSVSKRGSPSRRRIRFVTAQDYISLTVDGLVVRERRSAIVLVRFADLRRKIGFVISSHGETSTKCVIGQCIRCLNDDVTQSAGNKLLHLGDKLRCPERLGQKRYATVPREHRRNPHA